MIFYSNHMVSSYLVTFMDQSSSSTLPNIKLSQNMVVVLDPSKYSQLVQPMIVFLDHSIMKKALVMVEDILITQLSLAYLTTIYNKKLEIMSFKFKG